MALRLRQKQSIFARLSAQLILKAFDLGYEVTYGETYRSPDECRRLADLGKGIVNSLHGDRLAIDLNLFRNGRYLKATSDHAVLGAYWESLSGDDYTCVWGGSWGNDGNHYSIQHGTRK